MGNQGNIELDTSDRNKNTPSKGSEYGRNQLNESKGYKRQEELSVKTSTVKNSTM